MIHTVGPVWHGEIMGEEAAEELLPQVTRGRGEANGCRSIAFPAISTGIYGYPKEKAAKAAVEAMKEYFAEHQESVIEDVILVSFDAGTEQLYLELL